MNMDSKEGSSNLVRGRVKKSEKSRRVWTKKEEVILLLAMKDVVAQGWKSDNGFRGGYLKQVELIFKKHLPATDLRGDPHMNSKLISWKKIYYSLNTILNRSGVGFNLYGTFTVDCDDVLWESLVQTEKDADKIRAKSWPIYDDWKEIFGKDRATGEAAEDILEAVNELEREYSIMDESYTPGDYHVSLKGLSAAENGETSVCQSQPTTVVPKTVGKKHKSSHDGIEAVCALLNEISCNTNDRLEALATRVGYDQELGQARMEIYSMLNEVQELSIDDKLNICDILATNVEKLEVFRGLPQMQGLFSCSVSLNLSSLLSFLLKKKLVLSS